MKTFFRNLSPRGTRILYTVLSLTVLVVSTMNFSNVMVFNANGNDQCAWRAIAGRDSALLITDVVPGGVADVAGIRNGDVLIRVNGKGFTFATSQRLIDAVPVGEHATYLVERNGTRLEFRVKILRVFNVASLALYCLGLGFLIVGYVVVMTKPRGGTQRMFARYSIVAMLLFAFFGSTQYLPDHQILSAVFIISQLTAFVLAPPMFLSFFLHFPVRRPILDRRWFLPLLYGLSGSTVALVLAGRGLGIPNWVVGTLFVGIFASYLVGLGAFVRSYFSFVEPERRSQLRPILIGIAIGGSAALYLTTMTIIDPIIVFLKPVLLLPGLLLVAAPISFGYSIFKYRLMDIDVIIKRSLIYAAITAVIAVMYLLTVYGMGALISYFLGTEENNFLNVAALILIALAFDPLKRKIQEGVDRLFYQQRRNYQKALLEFSRELPQLINLKEILESIIFRISATMNVEKIAVVICSEKEGCSSESRNIDAGDCQFDRTPGGLMDLLARTRQPQTLVLLEEEHEPLQIHDADRARIARSGIVLTVPMFLKDRLIGSINVGPKMSGKVYSQEDIDLLSTVGGQAAIAIENARLHVAEVEKQRMEEEVRLAWKIQQGLLPKSDPEIPGLDMSGTTLPARTVGGDYFDFIRISPTRIFVVVADVSGKGMSAALYMSKVQGMVQLAAQMYASPKDILIHVNRRLYHGIERNSFITMIIALFDTEKNEVVLCRAGHNKALIATNGTLSYLDAPGIGLGLEQGTIFERELEEIRRPLKADGLFVFYSDGLTEAMNEQKSQFGEDAVFNIVQSKRSLAARDLRTTLIEEVRQFQGTAEQHDDMTLVVVKVGKS